MPRCPRRPCLATIPLRRSTSWPGCRWSTRARSFVLAVFRLVSIVPGSRRGTHDRHRSTQVMRRCLFYSTGVPLPAAEPCTTGPDLLFLDPATLLGFLRPSQYSLSASPGFFHPGDFLRPGCFWAVHPHLPLSEFQFAPLIFTGVDRGFQKLLPRRLKNGQLRLIRPATGFFPRAGRSRHRGC